MKHHSWLYFVVICIKCVKGELVPQVNTPLGGIQGQISKSLNGREFYAFEGIPYANPPVGKHRFQEPRPIKPWKGVWVANKIYSCMQYNHLTLPGQDHVIGDEDCLYVNVYTPILEQTASLDVIAFVHGGAFMFGAGGQYGPKFLVDRDVVFVTLNYRLGPLGFLSTEDEVVPGNNGLRDQQLALKWIKENIRYFGGNPESITLTGMSAGGASVHIHLMSPRAEGLFHKGISQSGTALNPWVLAEKSLQKAQKLASLVGCPSTEATKMVECLKRRPARQIVDAVNHYQPWLYNPFSPFGVVVDSWAPDPVLPDHPYVLLKSGKLGDLPWIFSHVQCEGLYPAAEFVADNEHLNTLEEKWNELIPHILDFNYTIDENKRDDISQLIKKKYLKDDPLTRKTFINLVEMMSDRLFLADIESAARLQSTATKSSTYYYYFSYRGVYSASNVFTKTDENFGVAHADDTTYVLEYYLDTQSTESDRAMSKVMVDIWITFANSSIPKVPNLIWPSMSKRATDHVTYLHIESPVKCSIKNAEQFGFGDFWKSLPIKENSKLYKVKEEL